MKERSNSLEEISFQVSMASVDPVKVSSNFLMQTKYSFLPNHFSTNMNRIQSSDGEESMFLRNVRTLICYRRRNPPPQKKINLKKWIKLEKQKKGRLNTLRDSGSGPCFKG